LYYGLKPNRPIAIGNKVSILPQRNSIFNMHVLVIGGSGQTGRLVIDEALQRGHKITALIRNPSALLAKEGLNIVKGTPLEPSNIESAFNAVQGDLPTAVIVTLSSPKEKGTRVMSDAHENLVAAMKRHGVSKIATMSSFGVGSSLANITVIMRWAISNTSLGHSFADHNHVDEILKKSGLKFVLLRPSRLTMAKKAPVQFLGDDGKGLGVFAGIGGISRASVVACLVDAVEKSTWDRSTPVISN
jgi:putative NADH-flavin reductase